MVSLAELKREFAKFSRESAAPIKTRDAWKKHEEFLRLYPFREDPTKIDELAPDRIYNPGDEYFFYWIEHGLKDIGRVGVGSAKVWENARNNPDKLKELLKIVVDDGTSLADKVDAPWEDISRFGGEKQIAKKIIFCYFPEQVIPTFSKAHLEHFCTKLDLDYETSIGSTEEDYDQLTEGEKFQGFCRLLLEFKNDIEWLARLDNAAFMSFLYHIFPPPDSAYGGFGAPAQTIPEGVIGVLLRKFKEGKLTQDQIMELTKGNTDLYEGFLQGILEDKIDFTSLPSYETAVVFLFGKLHSQLGFPLVTNVQPGYPDAEAIGDGGEEVRIEFKLLASQFDYPPEGCDYIVCWRNDLSEEALKKIPKVIALEEFILEQFL